MTALGAAGMLSLAVAAGSPSVTAQFRLGAQFGGDIASEPDQVSLDASPALTAGLGYYVRNDAQAALWYGLQPTTLQLVQRDGTRGEFDALVHHLMIGGTVEIQTDSIAVPFVEAGLGPVVLNVDDVAAGTATRFGMSLAGGLNLAVTEWLWIRAQIDLRLAFLGGGSLFCGENEEGSACLVGVGDVYVQGNGSGGLMLRF